MIDEPNIPYPPRYRYLKRLVVAYALFIGVIIATWYAWDLVTRRRFDAEVARLRGLGQMVLADDFNNQPTIPDDENAAVLLKQAMAVTFNAAQDDFDNNINWSLKLTDHQRAVLASFSADFAPKLQFARQARQRHRADWKQTYRSPLIGVMLPSLNPSRTLAVLLGYTAIAHHLDGDDAEAIECIRDILHESAMTDADAATLVEHLVAVGINAMACSRLSEIVDEMAIESDRPPLRHASTRPATRPAVPASRAQVKALIAELLDERAAIEGMVQSLHGEQAMVLDTVDWLTSKPGGSLTAITGGAGKSPPAQLIGAALRPMIRLSAVRMSGRHSIRAENARNSNYPAMTSNLPNAERDMTTGTIVRQSTRLLERILEPSLDRVFVTQARQLAERRAVAIKLALRLYQLDHNGQLPEKLDALVPHYLPAVPSDPFAVGRPMGYVRSMTVEDVQTPAIYSVGEDGTENHASTKPMRTRFGTARGQSVFDNPYDREDLIFPLKRPAPLDPPPPESPQTDDDEHQSPVGEVHQPDGQ